MTREEYEEKLFKNIVAALKRNGLETNSECVFLAGSFARGEATYSADENGDLLLESDVEIGVVYKSKKDVKRMIAAVTEQFEEELNLMPFSPRRIKNANNYNISFFPAAYKTLLTYDMANCHTVLWGKNLFENAKVSLEEVDIYEAKRLVANRIGEYIYTRKNNPSDSARWRAKTVCAVGTAYLLCKGAYEVSYKGQAARIGELSAEVNSALGENFSQKYAEAFSYLRENGTSFEIEEEALRKYVSGISGIFDRMGITYNKTDNLIRKVKVAIKYVRSKAGLNFIGAERRIVNALLAEYISGERNIENTAELWHKTLY